MRKIRLYSHYIILTLFCQFFLCCTPTFADVDNFYFESFEADYYLSSEKDGTSKLRVVENLTAIFPQYKQNKGICRMIPFMNKGGVNRTIKSLTKNDIKVLRNDAPEPIYSLEKTDTYYEVCTGTNDYVTGAQKYTFEYQFENVVTEYSNDGTWQELYWNTNGTGWSQKFNSLTARVHLENKENWTGKSWCYVGEYGESDQNRCKISESEDGSLVQFSTGKLGVGENLTFDLELKPNSFTIPGPTKNYFPIFVMVEVITICVLILIKPIKIFRATSEKRRFYRKYFIKTEYQPHKYYSLAELSQIYLGKIEDPKVALLLKMVVDGRIDLIRGDKKIFGIYDWSIKVKTLENISREEEIILEILNGGYSVEDGELIKVQSQIATEKLYLLNTAFEEIGARAAKKDGLIGEEQTSKSPLFVKCLAFIFAVVTVFCGPSTEVFFQVAGKKAIIFGGVEYIGGLQMTIVSLISVSLAVTIFAILSSKNKIYQKYRIRGLEASRYMDGLKLYIKMAEKDRLSFLQSVEGTDVSPQGVIKLYESLLPYAALFGVEESWMKELAKYYNLEGVVVPNWYATNSVNSFRGINQIFYSVSAASTASSHHYTSSSSSGGSSFSGGGGGGFSGGGGGGGGGHGR